MAEDRRAAQERRQAYYSGHVQGVGFRYTVNQLANRFEVTGFVRNLPDGRVELIVEGAADEISALMADIAKHMERHISRVAEDVGRATGEFTRFDIRH